MNWTCNYIAAALFHLETAMRLELTNAGCTAKSVNGGQIEMNLSQKKVKDTNFNCDGFSKRGYGRKNTKEISILKFTNNKTSQ